jgi:hypothetical protein
MENNGNVATRWENVRQWHDFGTKPVSFEHKLNLQINTDVGILYYNDIIVLLAK